MSRKMLAAIAAAVALASCQQVNAPTPLPETAQGSPKEPGVVAVEANGMLAGCDTDAAAAGGPAMEQFPVADGTTLLKVACTSGAYQRSFRLFIVRDGSAKPELMALADQDGGVWFGTTDAFEPSFDPQTGVLTTFAKGAGHGGCGSQGTYRWDGVRFALKELRARACSEPRPEGGAVEFPVIWTAPTQ